MNIVIINGPNLNLLGMRRPDLYGNQTMEEYLQELSANYPDVDFEYRQSNHEGDIIDWLQECGFTADGIILNPGGYAHSSVSIRDAIETIQSPVVEVHITDIARREAFRQYSIVSDVCVAYIIGMGMNGYEEALQYLIEYNQKTQH